MASRDLVLQELSLFVLPILLLLCFHLCVVLYCLIFKFKLWCFHGSSLAFLGTIRLFGLGFLYVYVLLTLLSLYSSFCFGHISYFESFYFSNSFILSRVMYSLFISFSPSLSFAKITKKNKKNLQLGFQNYTIYIYLSIFNSHFYFMLVIRPLTNSQS